MIRRLWTKLLGMFARPAPALAEVDEPTSPKVSAPKLGTPMPAGDTIVSPRLFKLASVTAGHRKMRVSRRMSRLQP